MVEIKGVRFLDTYSNIIKFSIAIELQGTEIFTLNAILKTIYQVRGFNITTIAVGNVFIPHDVEARLS